MFRLLPLLRRSVLVVALFFVTTGAYSQTAQVQLLHNAPDPALQKVDVYLDGELIRNNFPFREATSYLEIPADVPVSIAVAPANSSDVSDAVVVFTQTFASGQVHFAMIAGVANPSAFAANPAGESTALRLVHTPNARAISTRPPQLQFFFVHGVPDAPTVGIRYGAGAALLDGRGVNFTSATGHAALEPTVQTVSIVGGSGLSSTVESFSIDLDGLDGKAGALVASGFADPSANQNGPALTLLAVFADGSVLDLKTGEPSLPLVDIRFLHASADPGLDTVDVRLTRTREAASKTTDPQTDDLSIDRLGKGSGRSASIYSGTYDATISAPALAAAKSAQVEAPIAVLRNLVFEEGESYVVVLGGVTTPARFAPNPGGLPIALKATVAAGARDTSLVPDRVDVRLAHMITDMPRVDVYAERTDEEPVLLAEGLSFGDVAAEYRSLAPDTYTIRAVVPSKRNQVVTAFTADFSAQRGKAVVLPLYGFAEPPRNDNGPPPTGVVWNPDSTSPAQRDAVLTLFHAATRVETVDVGFKSNESGKTADPQTDDLSIDRLKKGSGRSASLSTGSYTVTVTTSDTSAAPGKTKELIATFQVTIEENNAYEMVLSDSSGSSGQLLEFDVNDQARSVLYNQNTPEIGFVNLMTDVESVDVLAYGAGTILVMASDLKRGQFSEYVAVNVDGDEGEMFTFYVTASGNPADTLLSFTHTIVPLRGTPERIPIIGSRSKPIVLDNESELPSAPADAFTVHGNYPNPFSGKSLLSFDLPESARVRLEIFDVTGRRLSVSGEEWMPAGRNARFEIDATKLPTGLYLYRLAAGGKTQEFLATGRFVVTR